LEMARAAFEKGIPAYELLHETGLCSSRGEARRLIEQGGAYVNDLQVSSYDEKINMDHTDALGVIRLRKGKKKHFLVVVK